MCLKMRPWFCRRIFNGGRDSHLKTRVANTPQLGYCFKFRSLRRLNNPRSSASVSGFDQRAGQAEVASRRVLCGGGWNHTDPIGGGKVHHHCWPGASTGSASRKEGKQDLLAVDRLAADIALVVFKISVEAPEEFLQVS